MTFAFVSRLLRGVGPVLAMAGPTTLPAPPAVVVPPPANQLVSEANAVPAAAGFHAVEVNARIEGRPARVRFGLVVPPGPVPTARGRPLVVSLSGPGAPAVTPPDGAACLTPECPAGHAWADPGVQVVLRQLVDGVVTAAGADRNRVYLTGVGPAVPDVWRLGAALADEWAAVAAIEGPAPADPAKAIEALWHVGVYLVVARDDGDARMLTALGDRPHPNFAERVEPGGDASAAAAAAYADPAFWGWMFAHHRSADTSPPPGREVNPHLGPPIVGPKGTTTVAVSFDPRAVPTKAGFAIVPATVRLGDKTLPFDFGLYLPPGWPHAAGYRGGPVATLVTLHWREFFGGADAQVTQETLGKLLVRFPIEGRHQGEMPADPVQLTGVAPVVCIMPHCPVGCRFEWTPGMAEAVGQLVDRVTAALHADPDRVVLTGVSYGGSSTWLVGQQIAARLAGVVPCDGRRTADPAATAAALRGVGVYVSVGDRDGDFTNDARVMAAALTAAGHPNVTYHEIHGGNHFCFSSTYTDPAFWAWLEAQRRQPPPGPPVLLASAAPATAAAVAPQPTPPPKPAPAPSPPPAASPAPAASPVPAAPAPAPKAGPAKPDAAKVEPPKVVAPPPAPPVPVTPPLPDGLTFDGVHWPATPGYHTVKVDARMDGKPVHFRFGLVLPPTFAKDGLPPWPVVMSLHNKGMIGGDGNGSITAEGLPLLLTRDVRDGRWAGDVPPNAIDLHAPPFVCVCPQCPTAHTFDDPAMLACLDQLLEATVANCRGDPERTYLTGFSYGASNTWLVAAGLADHFAAIAPIDGRATSDPDATVAKLARTGVYQVVGGNDDGFMPEAKRMVVALAARPHPDFAFHVVPGGNHFCYGSVYTDPTFWAWMFARRRTVPPKPKVATPPAVKGVDVSIDPAALPRRPGYAVVRPTVVVDGEPMSVPVGVWLPPAFPHAGGPMPVIVSLHNRYAIGMGGSDAGLLGEGLPMILAHGNPNRGDHGPVPDRPVNPATDVPFIGVFPQCPGGRKFEEAPMPEVIDKTIAAVLSGYGTAVADPDRVYGTAWSYGATCTWATATANPTRYAAVAINDGRAAADPPATVAKLHDVAVYLAVGENDGEFVDNERRMLDALLNGHHPNFAQRVVPHGDHASYMSVYADPAFWGWLLAQRRHH